MRNNKNKHELVIKPKKGFFSLDIHEMLEYKELLFFLALRNLKIYLKKTIEWYLSLNRITKKMKRNG